MGVVKRIWNAFTKRDPPDNYGYDYSNYDYTAYSSSIRPDRVFLSRGQEKTILSSIINRIALDVSSLDFIHCRTDDEGQFVERIDSKLNRCLTVEANIDQTARFLKHDMCVSLLDEGDIAIVPTTTYGDPRITESYDILELRVGKITQWWPNKIKVNLYNDQTGKKEDIIVPKSMVAIVESPLRAILNEPNSTAKRLNEKLSILDYIDRDSGSGKLNLLFQLPYEARTEKVKKRVEKRREDIQKQLVDNQYGIAYIDSTEKVIQLNRSVENKLFEQVEYYTKMLFSQLGLTENILNGTANEQELTNYYNMTIEPIASAIAEEMRRKFLSKTAISQHQTIKVFRDPFRMATLTTIASIGRDLVSAQIITSNEVRTNGLGFKPSDEPQANTLMNPNINPQNGEVSTEKLGEDLEELNSLDAQLDDLERELNHAESTFLAHSEYDPTKYDADKAHEYYEETKYKRGLVKGIYKQGNTLNNAGREAKARLKSQFDANRQKRLAESSVSYEKKIAERTSTITAQIKKHNEETARKIELLKRYLNNVPDSVKKVRSNNIKKQIDVLRKRNDVQRTRLATALGVDKSNLTRERQNANQRIKDESKSNYEAEVEKLHNNLDYVKTKKTSKTEVTTKTVKKKETDLSDYQRIINAFWERQKAKKK